MAHRPGSHPPARLNHLKEMAGPRRQVFVGGVKVPGSRRQVFVGGVEVPGSPTTGLRRRGGNMGASRFRRDRLRHRRHVGVWAPV